MKYELLNIVIGLVGFLLFMLIQGLVINGIHYCCQWNCTNDMNKGKVCGGNIFYKMFPKFFERNKDKTWILPFYSCVRCMASVYSLLTYWPFVIFIFGFQLWQIPVWVINLFCLTGVNFWIYKKL